jgi:hypothetical protein
MVKLYIKQVYFMGYYLLAFNKIPGIYGFRN